MMTRHSDEAGRTVSAGQFLRTTTFSGQSQRARRLCQYTRRRHSEGVLVAASRALGGRRGVVAPQPQHEQMSGAQYSYDIGQFSYGVGQYSHGSGHSGRSGAVIGHSGGVGGRGGGPGYMNVYTTPGRGDGKCAAPRAPRASCFTRPTFMGLIETLTPRALTQPCAMGPHAPTPPPLPLPPPPQLPPGFVSCVGLWVDAQTALTLTARGFQASVPGILTTVTE